MELGGSRLKASDRHRSSWADEKWSVVVAAKLAFVGFCNDKIGI